jgi:hypothetical protein
MNREERINNMLEDTRTHLINSGFDIYGYAFNEKVDEKYKEHIVLLSYESVYSDELHEIIKEFTDKYRKIVSKHTKSYIRLKKLNRLINE